MSEMESSALDFRDAGVGVVTAEFERGSTGFDDPASSRDGTTDLCCSCGDRDGQCVSGGIDVS